jgi:hypothetical protein
MCYVLLNFYTDVWKFKFGCWRERKEWCSETHKKGNRVKCHNCGLLQRLWCLLWISYGDDLHPGVELEITKSCYIILDVIRKWLEHLQKNRATGNCLSILNGYSSHWKSIHVFNFYMENDIVPMCLPAHCIYRLHVQPLDQSLFKPLKVNYFAEGSGWRALQEGIWLDKSLEKSLQLLGPKQRRQA